MTTPPRQRSRLTRPRGRSVRSAASEPNLARSVSQLTRRKVQSTAGSMFVWQAATAIAGILVARALGPEGKGIVASALVWPQVTAWVLLLGLNTASSVRASESRGALDHLLGNAVLYSVTVGAFGTLAGMLFLPRALDHLGPGAADAARITVLVIPLIMASEVISGINLGLGRTRHYNAARMTSGVLVLAATLALIAAGAATPESLAAAGSIVGLGSLAVGAHGLPWRRVVVAIRALRADISYGLRVFLTGVLGMVNYRVDILAMSAFLSAGQIGNYTIATSAMLPLVLVYTTATTLILPSIAKARGARGGESGDDITLIRRTALRYTLATAAVAVLLAAALPVAVPLIFGEAFRPAVSLSWILLPGFVATAYATIIHAGMVGMRTTWVGNASQGAGVLVTICLLPYALWAYGATGAAIVSSAAYTASAAVAVWGCSRVYRKRLPPPTDDQDGNAAYETTTVQTGPPSL